MLILGALGSFLEPFCGLLLPKVDKISYKMTLTYPHEGPCVESAHVLNPLRGPGPGNDNGNSDNGNGNGNGNGNNGNGNDSDNDSGNDSDNGNGNGNGNNGNGNGTPATFNRKP